MEASRLGLPIVMTDVGSAGELIINGQSGLVVPIGNSNALASAMEKLITNSDLRNMLGRGALAAVNAMPDQNKILMLYRSGWKNAMVNGHKIQYSVENKKI
jgi:glycosyltransferase involved in cell wall biosynthesis